MGRLLTLHVGLQRFDQSILDLVGGLEGSVRVVRKLKDAVKSSLRLQVTPAAMNAPSQVVPGKSNSAARAALDEQPSIHNLEDVHIDLDPLTLGTPKAQ